MFDAKALLDGLIGGQAQRAAGQPASGQQAGGLGGILGNLANELRNRVQQSGLGDVAEQVRQRGGLGQVAGNVFGQATGGVRDAAGEIDRRTGASDKFAELVGQLSGGKAPAELVAQAREMLANNPAAATAALGGLAAAIFGTRTGRGLAMDAAKLGGLALIGGLAYSAWKNHQQGKPLVDLGQPTNIAPPPAGSGFEPAAATNDHAQLLIRAMIAASAADGDIDAAERAAIIGGLKQSGLGGEANAWLEHEIANPASVEALVAAAGESPELAAQIYTAARLAITPDAAAESDFLRELADGLGLEPDLTARIDAQTAQARAA